ncbi:MAG: hypothetical protein AB7T22_08505 [Calditrichaceae bacterium]
MLNDEILSTIEMAHEFGSAFSRDQVHRFLRIPVSTQTFNNRINDLIDEGIIAEKNSRLMRGEPENRCGEKRQFSRALIKRYYFDLKILSHMPWVRFIGLTGANAFESCKQDDDIDLFLVTNVDKLWITYLLIVLFGKITGKRERLCLNYLVDENNLTLMPKNYYAAVQLVQMKPLINQTFKQRLINKNAWLFDCLPNAGTSFDCDPFYLIRNDKSRERKKPSYLLSRLNRYIYKNYRRRLERKYPDLIGNSIILGPGVAKLHRVDHQHIYDKKFHVVREKAVS